MFILILGFLIIGVLLIIYQKLKTRDKEYLYYIGIFITFICLIFLPLVDPLPMLGYFAAVIQERSFFSIFGAIAGFISMNIAIYGFAIFYSSIELITAERFKGKLITIKHYKKRRHPIFASYHIIGSSYFVMMGAPIGLIVFTLLMVLLSLEANRIDKISLRKFGEPFLTYKKSVPKRIYSNDILFILIINYSLLIIGVIGLVFFSEL